MWKLFIVTVIPFFALYAGLTRVIDHHHTRTQVFIGFAIGTFWSLIAYILNYDSIFKRNNHEINERTWYRNPNLVEETETVPQPQEESFVKPKDFDSLSQEKIHKDINNNSDQFIVKNPSVV